MDLGTCGWCTAMILVPLWYLLVWWMLSPILPPSPCPDHPYCSPRSFWFSQTTLFWGKSFYCCGCKFSRAYDRFTTVAETRLQWRSDFQSGSRVLKGWTFSYLYLWHTMWFHAKKLLRTLKFWKSLNSLCKSGSRPQKSPKKAQKTDHSIAIYSNFWIGMVYFGCHLVNPHVQTVQNMYGKGG